MLLKEPKTLIMKNNLKKVQGFRSYVCLELSERNETCYEKIIEQFNKILRLLKISKRKNDK